MRYVTRVAPSPTGDFHIGTARTAYFNWLAARATGGRFELRIDDTDTARNNEDAVRVIDEAMSWLGLDFDFRFRQSDRADAYAEAAASLLDSGGAVRADNGAVILSPGFDASWSSRERNGVVKLMEPSKDSRDLADGVVLMRGDGSPTYHFATVIDDAWRGVNLIIRGADHVTNTFRHAAIYRAIGAEPPVYAHVGLITKDKKKVSKRDSAASLLGWRDAGYDPDAFLNAVLRLGWGPTRDDKSTSVIPRDRALELFLEHGNLRGASCEMDIAKINWLDRRYKSDKEKTRSADNGPAA